MKSCTEKGWRGQTELPLLGLSDLHLQRSWVKWRPKMSFQICTLPELCSPKVVSSRVVAWRLDSQWKISWYAISHRCTLKKVVQVLTLLLQALRGISTTFPINASQNGNLTILKFLFCSHKKKKKKSTLFLQPIYFKLQFPVPAKKTPASSFGRPNQVQKKMKKYPRLPQHN